MSNDYKEYASKEWASLRPAKETTITDFLANLYNSAANVEDALRALVRSPNNCEYTTETNHTDVQIYNITAIADGYVGQYNTDIYFSSDGLEWSLMSTLEYEPFALLWDGDNGRLVALTEKGKKNYVSTDNGSTWTLYESEVDVQSYTTPSAVYGNGVFVIVGTYGHVYYSSDLTNWTSVSNVVGNYYSGRARIVFHNGVFCSMFNNKGGVSVDGVNWTKLNWSTSAYSGLDNCVPIGDEFVTYPSTRSGTMKTLRIRRDGTYYTGEADTKLAYCCNAGDHLIGVDSEGNVYTSNDGTTYTQIGKVDGTFGDYGSNNNIAYTSDKILFVCSDGTLTVWSNKSHPITPEMIGAIPAVDGKTDQILRYGSDGKLVPSNLPIYYLEGTEDNPIDIDLLVTPGRYYINGKTTSSYELVAAPGDQEISKDSRDALEFFRESLSSGNYFDVHVVNAGVFQVMNLYAGALSGMYSTIIRMIGSKEKCFAVLISKFFDDRLLEQAFSKYQPKISGTKGQIVGFDENGSAIAQDLIIPQNGVKAWTKLGEYTFSDQSDATPIVIENLGGMSEFVFICSGLTNNGQTDSGMTVKVNDFSVSGQVIPVYSAADKYTYVDLDFNGLYWKHQRTGPCNGEANFSLGGISIPYMITIGGAVADSITITPHNTYYATGGTLTIYGGK